MPCSPTIPKRSPIQVSSFSRSGKRVAESWLHCRFKRLPVEGHIFIFSCSCCTPHPKWEGWKKLQVPSRWCLRWHCCGWHPSNPGTGHRTTTSRTNRDWGPNVRESTKGVFHSFLAPPLQSQSVAFLSHLVNTSLLSKKDQQKGKKKKKAKKREMGKNEPLLLLPTNALHICYCIGSSWPDLTCKQWSPVNHQWPFTSPAAAGRVPVSGPITLTPPKQTTPIVHCHGLCFRDHLQCFGSKELLFSNSLTQGEIYLKTWLQQWVHALRITQQVNFVSVSSSQ